MAPRCRTRRDGVRVPRGVLPPPAGEWDAPNVARREVGSERESVRDVAYAEAVPAFLAYAGPHGDVVIFRPRSWGQRSKCGVRRFSVSLRSGPLKNGLGTWTYSDWAHFLFLLCEVRYGVKWTGTYYLGRLFIGFFQILTHCLYLLSFYKNWFYP
jgi:hypothetical protein